jgi:TolB protein
MGRKVMVLLLSFALLSSTFIFTVEAAHWGLIRVTIAPDSSPYGVPSITYNGDQIAFAARVNEVSQLFSVGWNGTGLKRLTFDSRVYGYPCISGDGTKIASYSYQRVTLSGEYSFATDVGLIMLNSDGTGLTTIVSSDQLLLHTVRPSLSNNGRKVAFIADNDEGTGYDLTLFVVNSDGTGLKQLASNLTLSPLPVGPSISSDGSKIAFSAAGSGGEAIFVINSDGTGLTELARNDNPNFDFRYPSISGDGKRIAFSSYSNGNSEIFVINSDGTELTQVIHNTVEDESPTISYDGSTIVFLSGGSVFVVNSDGTALTLIGSAGVSPPSISGNGNKIAYTDWGLYCGVNLDSGVDGYVAERWNPPTQVVSHAAGGTSLSMSADGRKIAFVSDEDGDAEIFVIDSDGTGLTKLTNNTTNEYELALSADGQRVAFISSANQSDYHVFVINTDGSVLTELFSSTLLMTFPSISGDGSKVAFACRTSGSFWDQLLVVDLNGNVTKITDEMSFSAPLLSRDGRKVVFKSAGEAILIANSDGTGIRQLVPGTHSISSLSMSADANRIAFIEWIPGKPEVRVVDSNGTLIASTTANLPPVIYAQDPPSIADLHDLMYASISGDGNRIVFACKDIFVVNLDGTELKQLTNVTGVYEQPLINDDGSIVAFLSRVGQLDYEIYVSFDPNLPVPTASPTQSASPPPSNPETFLTVMVATASVVSVVFVSVGLLVYFKKRKH